MLQHRVDFAVTPSAHGCAAGKIKQLAFETAKLCIVCQCRFLVRLQGGYAAAQQREWHVHATYGHGTPPLSPSATSIDFTRLSGSGATAGMPSASAASANGGGTPQEWRS